MAKPSSSSENEAYCSKFCRKNTEDLNTKITELSEKLSDTKTSSYHYKLGLLQVEARLVEFKNQEIKFYEKIRGLEFNVESKNNRIKRLTNELEQIKKEKKALDNKLTGFESASKDLDTLLKSQRSDKNKEGLGYSAVPPLPAQVYSPPKKDMSWIGLPEFTDDTITDYSRPSPSIESNSNDLQSSNSFVSENEESSSSILSKPVITFGKAADSPTGKVVKASACWIWRPKQNTTDKGPNSNSVSVIFKKYQYIDTQDDKGYWDNGCSRHVTGNMSYLSDYELYDGGYVSFGQGGGKIIGKGIIKTGKLEFKNVYFVKDLKYNLFSVSQICDNKNSVLFNDSECIVLGRDFKLKDDTNVLLRTPRQHNMYSIDLNNIVPHKDLNCLVVKASVDECMLWHRRLVVTDDFSRFTWTFFIKTKDETSDILRNFINEIENLKELKVQIISNARTPQQNGVVERRNRNLIEAARIMLAGVKLPITFWAEAVNTVCYVQNRVLRSLMQKGDEGYFIGYSMSSKTFRVFNKRTKRVEENLHVDFLENKLIEKGAGPNWLFDIDTLTNSMKHVPVVVAGTSSTNFLGTKDAASQDVKKDVSSLRYIALPNWFHEAHLESSTSNAQDACNADALKSSGNSNPIATSTNLLADHMETLIVESAIPTVSSPVLTACLDDSPKPSSDTRLILKRVTSQDDTPSLDYILNLSNRFEDILRVTTNTGDTNRVEADLGNMENNISASPTPTFRIHKDHPKS
nr:hypothetical protein [Tanacetum cinerariifolium]